MKRILTLAAVAAMLFTACSKDEGGLAGAGTIRIDPTIANPPITPGTAATRATDTDFESGDQLGITITMDADGTFFANNMQLTYDTASAAFTTSSEWYEDTNATATLFAYYPYQAGEAAPTEFSVHADQSAEGYAASDLITAVKSGVKPTKSATEMTFKHRMTRLIIDVTNESGSDITAIVIKNSIQTGTIDQQTGLFAGKTGVEPADITAYPAIANTLYYAWLVPQMAVKLSVSVTTADGKTRTQSLATTDLNSGENRRMSANVQPADLTIGLGGAIDGLTDGEDLLPDDGGTTTDTPTVEWGGVKYKIVTLKDGRTWMAENLRYIPEGKSVSADPTLDAGIWYPQEIVGSEGSYTAQVSTDASYIKKVGYYYDFFTAAGGITITADNYLSFERIQGICPDGWHIPTQAEVAALAAAYSTVGATGLDDDGFNLAYTQMRSKGDSGATGAYSTGGVASGTFTAGCIMSSTGFSYTVKDTGVISNMNKYLMFMSTTGKLTVANVSTYAGLPVRCIQNAE